MKKILASVTLTIFISVTAFAQYRDPSTGKEIKGYLGPVSAPAHDDKITPQPSATPAPAPAKPDYNGLSKEDNDARIKAADKEYDARLADDRRVVIAREVKAEEYRNGPFELSNGNTMTITYIYDLKMKRHLDTRDFKAAVACHDTLMVYLKSINNTDGQFYDSDEINTTEAYFGLGDYETGMRYFTPAAYYKFTRHSEYVPHLLKTWWTGYDHLPQHKEYLDSIRAICHTISEKKYPMENDHFLIQIHYARCYLAEGKYANADSVLNAEIKYVEKNKKTVDVFSFYKHGYYYFRALSAYKQGRMKDAEKDCRKSAEVQEAYKDDNKALLALVQGGK